ncbi:flagellar assembly protein FliW [Oceanobacillus senegalensis]|uniref:flagellar assembly protein FliW n=1 Tax=Oceanobacillus senegalensis TaxID=1936063 RepID=UPI000A30A593|nr:flagellar assembly protein FliW [Oceanobacillus senegalensis]
MKIQTKYLGEMEIDESKVITFANGIPGFNDEKEFVLLNLFNDTVYQLLQSVHTSTTAFIVINPYLIYQDYSFELDDSTLEQLGIKQENEVVVLSIVTLKDPFHASTLNLKAPLIINSKRMLGKQYILTKEEYPSKALIHPKHTVKGVK